MKLASKMFALTALAVACSAASAQQTAPLTVTGNITPAACTASMSNDGAFKYADIDVSTLSDASTTALPASPAATFNISCMGEAQVTWAIVDNRPGTSYDTSDTGKLGLGTDSDGNKIGSYHLMMSSPAVDGVTNQVYAMKSTNGGSTWAWLSQSGYMLRPAQLYTYSKDNGYNPGKAKTFSATVIAYPTIAPKSTLNTTGEIDLQGNATINLGYL